jgi:hypothetical protein
MINGDINVYRKELQNLVDQYGEWDWFCVMDLESGTDASKAKVFLNKWRTRLFKKTQFQLCYVGLLALTPQPRIHLLVAGLDQFGYPLSERDWSMGQYLWDVITKQYCVIEIIDHPDMVTGYINRFDAQVDEFELLRPCNLSLLTKRQGVTLKPDLEHRTGWNEPLRMDKVYINMSNRGLIGGELVELKISNLLGIPYGL